MMNTKHQKSVFAFFMALFMSGAMSFLWVALPVTFLITAVVGRLVLYLLNPNEDIH
mgnify:CR=1 FL=1